MAAGMQRLDFPAINRAVWWSHWREGTRLPAERGVILIDGGRT